MDGITQQFMWSLQALAQPADVQRRLFSDFACKADELALDFAHWRECMISNHPGELSSDQLQLLNEIDGLLSEMSGRQNAHHWTEAALGTDPKWEKVRVLARRALAALGWTEDIPPTDRSIYIGKPPK